MCGSNINGEESDGVRGAGSDQILDTGESLLIIGARMAVLNPFPGKVDDVWLFDEPLLKEEIRQVMTGQFGGCSLLGDIDCDDQLDVDDVNALIEQIRSGEHQPNFDFTGDELVTTDDLNTWVKDLKSTWFGDANLDGEFNSSDFVLVFQAGKFEQATPAKWEEGEWNGDGTFGSNDFVAAFQDGGFERGPIPANQAVPEPSTAAIVWIVCFAYTSAAFLPVKHTRQMSTNFHERLATSPAAYANVLRPDLNAASSCDVSLPDFSLCCVF